jgi:hypothetical protein
VVSGADLGFRIEGQDLKGLPFGRLVVKIDGDWVPVSDSIRMAPAITTR